MSESVLDIMSGGVKAPGAFNKYSQIGETYSGRIDSVEVWDVRDFTTQQVKTWDDGRPQKQLRIVFQADNFTPQDEDDTGLRAHYVKAWNPHLKTLREALAAVGEQEPKAGGWISIRYDRDEPSKGGNDVKIYVYQYQPPASNVFQAIADQQPGQSQLQQGYQQQPQAQPAQQAAQPQQFSQQQTPVAPVANVHTQQGQVDPSTGEIVGQAQPVAPVPAQQPAQPQQAQQGAVDPWTGQPVAQQPQQAQPQPAAPQQAAPQQGPAAGAGMDANIMKLVQAGLDDNTIVTTLAAQGVTAQQVAEVRQALGS
jgi:hypothetical protein